MKYDAVTFVNSLDELPLNSKVCLYGAALGGTNFKSRIETARKDIEILYFIDDYKKGEKHGIKILSPDKLTALKGTFELVLIVSAYWKKMQERLIRLKIDNYKVINPYLYFDLQIFTEAEQKKYRNKFEKVKGLLAYEQDRILYDLILENRKIKQKDVDNPHKYFLRNLNRPSQEYLDFIDKERIHTVVEGGVFDGESTLNFLRLLPKDIFIYGFEPAYETYIESKYRTSLEGLTNIKIYPLALWKNKSRLTLFGNKEARAGSKIISNINQREDIRDVDAVSIDEFVRENNIQEVDFIKLDVEGSELEILQGAKKVLMNHRPQLAICLYHRKEHMFEIPLFLDKTLEHYQYRIAHYSSTFWDTVLYAIPDEVRH